MITYPTPNRLEVRCDTEGCNNAMGLVITKMPKKPVIEVLRDDHGWGVVVSGGPERHYCRGCYE